MGRIRTIKPEFHSHEELSTLPPETHLLAGALVNYADDEGYFNANPILVKAGTNPLRNDGTKIERQIEQLEQIGYIEVRRAGVKHIGKILTFENHQRVSHPTPSKLKSKFEELPKNSGGFREQLRPELKGIEGNGTGNREASTADAVPASPAFITFPMTQGKKHIVTEDDIRKWAQAYPAVDIRQELRKAMVWLDAHPDKCSHSIQGSKQRIVRWLGRSQDQGGRHVGNEQDRSGARRESAAAQRQRQSDEGLRNIAARRYGVPAADEANQGSVHHSRDAGNDAGDVSGGVGGDGDAVQAGGFQGRTIEGHPG